MGIGNPAAMAAMGDAFRAVGPEAELSGVRYRLGLIFPRRERVALARLV